MKKIIILFLLFYSKLFAYELPELGSSFDSLISNADEKKIKFQIMNQVYSNNSVIRDPEINEYIKNLGKDLISKGLNEKISINFFILEDKSINAFAMLGNIIGIHSGLILSSNTESELASVISHEIAHITQKHLLRLFDSQEKNTYKSYLSLALALLVARSNPQLANAAIAAGAASQVQNILEYTRDNEREADRIGLKILNQAGYDPKGFIDFFSTMQKFNNFSTGAAPAFLRTHPVTTERISDIQDRLNDYKYIQKKNKIEFFLVKAKLQAFHGEVSNTVDIFINDLKFKRYLSRPATYFGLVYALLKDNRTDEARFYFNELLTTGINSPMIYELEANLLIKEKKVEDAFQLYKRAIKEHPYYQPFIVGISKLLIGSNNVDKAIEFINSYLPVFENEPILYELLSRAYSIKGLPLMEHESLSSFYYYQYNIKDAISQMDMATRVNSENFYDQSRVEFKMKELRREEELMNQ